MTGRGFGLALFGPYPSDNGRRFQALGQHEMYPIGNLPCSAVGSYKRA